MFFAWEKKRKWSSLRALEVEVLLSLQVAYICCLVFCRPKFHCFLWGLDCLLQRGEKVGMALSGQIKASCSPVYPASSGGFSWMPRGEWEQSKHVVLPPSTLQASSYFQFRDFLSQMWLYKFGNPQRMYFVNFSSLCLSPHKLSAFKISIWQGVLNICYLCD